MILNSDLEARVYQSAGLDRTRGIVMVTGGRYKTDTDKTGKLLDTVQAFAISQPAEAKITAGSAPAGAPQPAASVLSLPTLRQLFAKPPGKPILVYFYAPEVPACKRAWDNVVGSPRIPPDGGRPRDGHRRRLGPRRRVPLQVLGVQGAMPRGVGRRWQPEENNAPAHHARRRAAIPGGNKQVGGPRFAFAPNIMLDLKAGGACSSRCWCQCGVACDTACCSTCSFGYCER